MAVLSTFLWLWPLAALVNLAAYAAGGIALAWLCARHPERRIQAGKDGAARVRDDVRESVVSIVTTAFCVALALALAWHGVGLWGAVPATWWATLLAFPVTFLLHDAWFYWMHRAFHHPCLWRFHRGHHRSTVPTVWSSDSQGVVETVATQAILPLMVLLLPLPWTAILVHRTFDHFSSQFGHAGHEFFAGPTARRPWPLLCTTFHDRHHERFRLNYGQYLSLWDRWMGTIDPDYDRDVAAMERRAAGTPAE